MMRWLDRHTVFAPHMALCLSEREYKNVARHCGVKDPLPWLDESRNKALLHTWEDTERLMCVVCLHPDAAKSDLADVYACLVHEAVHIFQRLCNSIGENMPSGEFEAYSIERIFSELMREFNRKTTKKSARK